MYMYVMQLFCFRVQWVMAISSMIPFKCSANIQSFI